MNIKKTHYMVFHRTKEKYNSIDNEKELLVQNIFVFYSIID